MKKTLLAVSIAGMSMTAMAQSNVTIYGTVDLSSQGTTLSQGVGQTNQPSGSVFNLKSNDSNIGFKGTEDLGNGLKGLFQAETYVNITGSQQGPSFNNATLFGNMRDSYVGMSNQYGSVLAGYLTTPYRASLLSFDVFPGDRGDARIETMMGKQRFGYRGAGLNGTGYVQADSSVRATALAYSMPTLYGFDGSIAYTGSNNNGTNNQTTNQVGANTQTNLSPQGVFTFNLGWTGYGVNVKGAFSQAKVNATLDDSGVQTSTPYSGYTSYLVGAQYTGIQGLKAGVVFNRNSLGVNATGDTVANKGTNNQIWAGASYRFGRHEPRVSYVNTSNTAFNGSDGQDGGNQYNLGYAYHVSKRSQVYALVSHINNNANGVWAPYQTGSNMLPTGGQQTTTYGLGYRTNF